MNDRQHESHPSEAAPVRSHGGRDALVVFFGTLGLASVALNLALTIAPERFGLRPVSSDETPSSPAQAEGAPKGAGAGSAAHTEPLTLAPRPSAADDRLAFAAPRSAEDRAFAEPTLAEVIFQDAEPSVVHVTTLDYRRNADHSLEISGVGSGLVWDRDGHIVTSKHVVDNINGATVTLSNGAKYQAKYVGQDPANDLAVIRIDAPAEFLTPIRIGTSEDLVVGMTVFSVACPYGLDPCLTAGHISGLGRSIRSTTNEQLSGVIQTDAPLHRGSSGGALIDDQGRVIGLNAAIHQDYFRYGGVGFAVSIDVVREAVPGIIRDGLRWYRRFGFTTLGQLENRRSLEGALKTDARQEAEAQGRPRPVADVPRSGLVIEAVLVGSSAARSGLRGMLRQTYEDVVVRDIIVSAGGRPVASTADLEEVIHELGPDDPLLLEVARPDGIAQVELR